jgi:hypothetical protein
MTLAAMESEPSSKPLKPSESCRNDDQATLPSCGAALQKQIDGAAAQRGGEKSTN